jgi:formiminotetrahydrofolate cyclodeaminase
MQYPQQVSDFVGEVSRDTRLPGGGSIAALAGTLGSALAYMVANLSIGKGEFDSRYDDLCRLAEKAQSVKNELLRSIDADTEAFNEVITTMRLTERSAWSRLRKRYSGISRNFPCNAISARSIRSEPT